MNDLPTAVDEVNMQAGNLPAPNHATTSFLTHAATMIDGLRSEQHQCDDMIAYWTERRADVTRTLEGLQAAHQEINRVAERQPITRVVTPRKPKVKQEQQTNG